MEYIYERNALIRMKDGDRVCASGLRSRNGAREQRDHRHERTGESEGGRIVGCHAHQQFSKAQDICALPREAIA